MKKFISISLVIFMISAIFCSCASKPSAELTEENVTKTIETSFDALQKVDKKTLDTYVDSKTLAVILDYTEKHEQFKELGVAMFANLSYEIKSIDLDSKTVTLEVKNKELGPAATEFTQSLLRTYSVMQLLERLSNDAWLDNNLSKLTAKIDEAEMKEAPAEITVKIEQKKENLVLVFDENAENEISGGVLGAINSITTGK